MTALSILTILDLLWRKQDLREKTAGSRNSKKWMFDGWCLARILTNSQKLHLASS